MTRVATIHDVPVTRNVAHCADMARCRDQARHDADDFVIRMARVPDVNWYEP